ncbi:MAG TPA: protein kinase [Acidimicrobiales bacterium]
MVGSTSAPQLPGYRDLTPLGRGGYSEVFRAYQDQFDRWVAVKVLTFALADDRAQRRFLRECRVAGRLSAHPNIVTVYDAGLSPDGRPYISMELFDRGSIADRLRSGGPFAVPDVLRIAIGLAGALETAHRAGVVHRDVKPGNVLLASYGQPALTDFGLSILAERQEVSVGVDALTPYHAPPEVLERTTVTPTSDVYSLASTTFAMLAGRAPHQRGGDQDSMASLLLRILQSDVPAIGREDVPPSLDTALRAALARDAHARTPTALAFAQALQQVQAELGLEVTQPVVMDAPQSTEVPAPPGTLADPSPGVITVPTDSPGPTLQREATLDYATAGPGEGALGPPPAPGPAPQAGSPAPPGQLGPAPPPGPPGPVPVGSGAGAGGAPTAGVTGAAFVAGAAPSPDASAPPGAPDHAYAAHAAPPGAPAPPDGASPGTGAPGTPSGDTWGPPGTAPPGTAAPGTVPPGTPGAPGAPAPAGPSGGFDAGFDGDATVHRDVVRRARGQEPEPEPPSKLKKRLLIAAAVLVLAGGGVGAYLALSGGDDGETVEREPTTTTTEEESTPRVLETPQNLRARESEAGVLLEWDGDEAADYIVLVMSEADSPEVLPPQVGATYLVPSTHLRDDVGYCFAVALLSTFQQVPAQDAAQAFSAPTCIRGASAETVLTTDEADGERPAEEGQQPADQGEAPADGGTPGSSGSDTP